MKRISPLLVVSGMKAILSQGHRLEFVPERDPVTHHLERNLTICIRVEVFSAHKRFSKCPRPTIPGQWPERSLTHYQHENYGHCLEESSSSNDLIINFYYKPSSSTSSQILPTYIYNIQLHVFHPFSLQTKLEKCQTTVTKKWKSKQAIWKRKSIRHHTN